MKTNECLARECAEKILHIANNYHEQGSDMSDEHAASIILAAITEATAPLTEELRQMREARQEARDVFKAEAAKLEADSPRLGLFLAELRQIFSEATCNGDLIYLADVCIKHRAAIDDAMNRT